MFFVCSVDWVFLFSSKTIFHDFFPLYNVSNLLLPKWILPTVTFAGISGKKEFYLEWYVLTVQRQNRTYLFIQLFCSVFSWSFRARTIRNARYGTLLTFSNIFTDSGGMWVHKGKGRYRKNTRERAKIIRPQLGSQRNNLL